MNDAQIQILYDAATIEQKVVALGQRLQADLAEEDPILISILGGSVVFLADLLRAIQKPVRYETVQVQYTETGGESDVLDIHFPISISVKDQSLLVLKDVVATGVTESYLAAQFQDLGAKSVQYVTLIDIPEERKLDIPIEYGLFTPKRAGTFVGYGLKVGGRYGNLPYLGRLIQA